MKTVKESGNKRRLIIRIILIALIAAVLIIFVPVYAANRHYLSLEPVTNEQLDALQLDGCRKLMIVAHPDDDYIWGGAHLFEGDYFVVVLTNARNECRRAEFETMLKNYGGKGLILGYPDKVGGRKSDWTFWEPSIKKDIQTLINYKDWDLVVTHNEEGEYGHVHHKATHRLTVEAFRELGNPTELYFFGTYYRKVDLPEDLPSIDEEAAARKLQYTGVYESQSHVIEMFYHMLTHENWQHYEIPD